MSRPTRAIRKVTRRFGVDLVRYTPPPPIERISARPDAREPFPRDFPARVIDTIRQVEHATMTGAERIEALINAVEWIEHRSVPGAIVECGVWRGGSTMAAALTLIRLGSTNRDLYLYDTFAGMTEADSVDLHYDGQTAAQFLAGAPYSEPWSDYLNVPLLETRRNLEATGYPRERIHYVEGPVEETLPARLPGPVAVLRLDTDFYESTRVELQHLYPLVVQGGVVIIDDYASWQGQRRAVDEFLAHRPEIFLHRIDITGRLFVKHG